MVAASTTRLRLRVVPGAPSNGIVGRHGDAWKVRVAAPPEDGRANDAVVRLLAEMLGVARGDVMLVAGHGSRDKVVEVAGIEPDELERRLEAASA
jgi:uncharacterized protein (TIGR00251 family)